MTVILVDARRPAMVPVEAVEFLGGDVQYTEDMPIRVQWSLPSARSALIGPDAPVLLSSDPAHPEVRARLAAGEKLIAVAPPRAGERLVDAVEVMDRLRTAGPWESEQTHDSLRRYLLEETYELFDAVRGGNSDELRDELGDVLLQVLFHARIAEDAPTDAFNIDDVADALLRKLGNRVPAVLAGEPITLEDQLAQWEDRKAAEKASAGGGHSCVDGVPTGQPALALTQKVVDRVTAAGVPDDLIPIALRLVRVSTGGDAENTLRATVLAFLDNVRAAEQAIAVARLADPDVGSVSSAEQWRQHWPATGDTSAVYGPSEYAHSHETATVYEPADIPPAAYLPDESPVDSDSEDTRVVVHWPDLEPDLHAEISEVRND